MAAVLDGRGEGDGIDMIAEALHRTGYIDRLCQTERFQKTMKATVRAALLKTQQHWTPRHAVHVWDRLELSRTQMETLNHLLSDIYSPEADAYEPIHAWTNPFDDSDFLSTPRLAARWSREREYRKIADAMNIQVSASGRCERDVIKLCSKLYSDYAGALRSDFTSHRPAQPVLFLDGTGGSIGRGVSHGELGCADFKGVGDADTKQSRATLQPLFAYEGTDHSGDLRANLELTFTSYNKLVAQGSFERQSLNHLNLEGGEPTTTTEKVPARPMTAADMQGAKSTFGMHSMSHSVWCKCQRGGSQHKYPTETVATYADVLKYCKELGCEIKTHEELCSWAHFSPGVAKGGRFTSFSCSCCGYAPSEKQWRADMKEFNEMNDADQKAARAAHRDADDELNSHFQHFHQELFMPPMPNHGMERCGVDQLHLVFLNMFKHLFKYTVHEGLPASRKKLVSNYLKAAGFYSYDAASVDEDPTAHWIGREVKRFLFEADKHVPFLLQLASAPADVCEDMALNENDKGEQEMEYDDEYAPTEEELEQEEKEEPIMMQNAARWDNFLALVRSIHVPWPQGEADTTAYREGRAVEAFNLAAKVAHDLMELKPTLLSWVPHVAVFIVPRQMVSLGDPARRACDACESFGAMFKKLIKHSTCRRRVMGDKVTTHNPKATAQASARRWKQTFNRGYIEQAFTRACVRESLQHGAENAPYRQRVDVRRTTTGKATVSRKSAEDSPAVMRPMTELCGELPERVATAE